MTTALETLTETDRKRLAGFRAKAMTMYADSARALAGEWGPMTGSEMVDLLVDRMEIAYRQRRSSRS